MHGRCQQKLQTSPSQRFNITDHLLTLFGIRQTSSAGLHIILHMMNLTGGRNRAIHRRMGNHKLEEELAPASAIKFLCKIGQGFALNLAEQAATLVWPVNDDCDTFSAAIDSKDCSTSRSAML